MRAANKDFKFRGPSKLLDFGNADVADITSVIAGVLQDVQEVEELLITDVNKAACATKVNLGPTLPNGVCQFSISCAIII
jgi:hypothetical protein